MVMARDLHRHTRNESIDMELRAKQRKTRNNNGRKIAIR